MMLGFIKNTDNKKIALFICIFFFGLFSNSYSNQIIKLPDIIKPVGLNVDKNDFYIVQDFSVFIYSRKDNKLIKKLGKRGEGPGEFRFLPKTILLDNGLILKSLMKMTHYSKDYQIIREKVFSSLGWLGNISYVKGSYVINYLSVIDKLETLNYLGIYGKDLKKKKIIASLKYSRKNKNCIELLRPRIIFKCYKNKIYVVNTSERSKMSVFNSIGEQIKTIDIAYKKNPIDIRFKQKYLDKFFAGKSEGRIKRMKKRINYIFPENFPSLIDFYIDSGKIYILTYEVKSEQTKYIIVSTEGQSEGSIFLPRAKKELICFNNKRFFYMEEDEDTEDWQLNMVDLPLK